MSEADFLHSSSSITLRTLLDQCCMASKLLDSILIDGVSTGTIGTENCSLISNVSPLSNTIRMNNAASV